MNRGTRTTLRAFQILGIVLVAIGLVWSAYTVWFKATSERTQGTIVRIDSSQSGGRKRKIKYRPVFTFIDKAGRMVEAKTWNSSNQFGGYTPGQEVPVLYRASDPEGATIDSFRILWMTPLLTCTVGLAFVALPTVLVRKG